MTVTCAIHGTVLADPIRCEQCLESNIADFNERFAGLQATWSFNAAPGKILVDGKPGRLLHEWSYIERDIPEELEDEISEYIAARIERYEASCECVSCRTKRGVKS